MWPWPLTSKINRVYPLTMVNMSVKFDKEIHNGSVSIVFTSLFPYNYVHCDLDLWHPKSIGFILSSWLTCLPSLIKKHTLVLFAKVFTSLFPYMRIVTLTSEINRVHSITMANMSAKFDQETHNGLVANMFTSLFPYTNVYDLDLWPPNSIGSILLPWFNMSAKFDKEIHKRSVSVVFTSLIHICPLWPWPLTSKIKRVHPLIMVYMSAKVDQETHNGLVTIVCTSLFPSISIVTLIFDL